MLDTGRGRLFLPQSQDGLANLRAARWERESTKQQLGKYGPEAQREMQDRAIAELGLVDTGLSWRVAKSGWSGPESMNEPPATRSPAFKAMVAAAQRGEYDVLLVAYTSRFIRDLALALHYRRVFHRAGVVIFMCDDGILTSDDRDWDRFVEKCKAAEVSSRDQSKNVKSGLMTKKVRYRDPGGLPPLGFRRRKDASKLMEPDPDALGTVRRAFELSASGIIDREIAAELSLTVHVVRGTLRSPLYIGRLQDGTPASWQPVISVDLWNKVQVMRSTRATTAGRPASPSRPYALSGRLKCRACGKGLIGDTGFYRHNDACRAFRRATPERPRDGTVARTARATAARHTRTPSATSSGLSA